MDLVASMGCGKSLAPLALAMVSHVTKPRGGGLYITHAGGPAVSWKRVGCMHNPHTGGRGTADYTGHKNTLAHSEGLLSFNPRIPESLAGKTCRMKSPLLSARNLKSGKEKGLHRGCPACHFRPTSLR